MLYAVDLGRDDLIFLWLTRTVWPVGGLTQNDFILASKINDMDFTDLMPKKKMRFWA